MNQIESNPKYLDATRAVSIRLSDLLSRMTVEEKLSQLTAYWFHDLLDGNSLSDDRMRTLLGDGIGQISRVGGSSTLPPVEVARAGNRVQRFLKEHTRLRIPALLHEECCFGYMGLGGTIFPQMIGLAGSWNPELVERVAREIRRQMLSVGARQGLAPGLDIGADPRWGRIEETFGEDPLLVTRMGVAYIRGVQGDDPAQGILATGKHFIGHSLSDGGLNCAPVRLGPRTMREVNLMPFQAAVAEAGIRSVMNAYIELDGEVVAASRPILTDLLRGELGFEGTVVSDYDAITMLKTYHRVAADEREAAVKALRAGIDAELPTRVCYGEPLRAALDEGLVSIEEIDASVRRILQAKFELGLFENSFVDEGRAAESFETADQRALAREAAAQTLVLLKNDGTLPLKNPRTIAVIGPNADSPRNMLGDYSYAADVELMTHSPVAAFKLMQGVDQDFLDRHSVKVPSILEGIRERAGTEALILHAWGCPVVGDDRTGIAEAAAAAKKADVVILVLGDKSGLTWDCTCGETRDRTRLGLPGVQDELVRAVAAAGKPIVAVLINGRPASIPWLQENASAILEAWLPGEEGAAAVADALFGSVNPGGKLPVTVARSAGQVPMSYNHKPSGNRSFFYEYYMDSPNTPLYPFGHGLSYTTFEYAGLSVTPAEARAGSVVDIRVKVANAGKTAGDEVVQLYVCDPLASTPRPVKELKGFRRISLAPGETRTVIFHLPVDLLAFYDEALDLVAEAGKIEVMIGGSSEDIRLTGGFTVIGPPKVKIARRVFNCPVEVQ
ncbi:MAG: glycoside hydrolase family 3 C-terminal domain-containing protein [Anaerolineales bacterium]|nr:glycoside hydrolase family 3 C-terminal domain-containing protein [Anaerolineales bacterium]